MFHSSKLICIPVSQHVFINISCRERYLNFICSLNLPEDISLTTAYKMFSQNLSKAEMLTYGYVFNVSNWAEELDFLLGNNDKAQWNVSSK